MPGEKTTVALAAGDAAWEVEALRALSAPGSGVVVIKRCLDLPDLLAAAGTGQVACAVVSDRLDGLDADSLARLRRGGLGVVLVGEEAPAAPGHPAGAGSASGSADAPRGAAGLEVDARLPPGAIDALPGTVVDAARGAAPADPAATPPPTQPGMDHDEPGAAAEQAEGCVLAVWGPTGAPGRTTVAVGVAAELAVRGVDTLLVDADPYGGAVGQHLGVLDEVSGLLSAARAANAGRLDVPALAAAARTVSPRLRLLTGLPRADRWVEVRSTAFDDLVATARRLSGCVVLDLGFCLEDEGDGAGGGGLRNQMTLGGLSLADELVVVGSADPVGLARLARGLVELGDRVPLTAPHVTVNRMRPSVGWGRDDVRGMIDSLLATASVHFLPDDRDTTDRALALGVPLTELGDSPLRGGLQRLVDGVGVAATPALPDRRRGGLRRRRAGRGR